MLKQLTLATIGDLNNGTARAVITKELNRAIADLEDRGTEDGKVRKVTIDLEMAVVEGLVVVNVSAQAKLPAHRTGSTVAKPKQHRGEPLLFFEDLSPANPDQPAFDEMNKHEE